MGAVARASNRRNGSVSSARAQSCWSSRGGPGQDDGNAAPDFEDQGRRGAGDPDDERAFGQGRLLANARLVLDARACGDLGCERLVEPQLQTGCTRKQLDRPVVVRRPEPAGDDEQVVPEAVAERRLELGGRVADDSHLHRLDPERLERSCEERTVQVGAVAPNELRPGDDDRGAQRNGYAGCPCHPLGPTVSTQGR